MPKINPEVFMVKREKVQELIELYELSKEELISISSKITKENFKDDVEFCSIISAKTGLCPEDCKYCSQSMHNNSKVETHSLVSLETVEKAALTAKENGASRFCIVTSGTGPSEDEFDEILKMINTVVNINGLKCCCSLGILTDEQAKKLAEAGVERYNHNLNTARSYHNQICTTHSYDDRVKTIKLVKKYGIQACCGGIIGMGESREQRIELAVELAELNPTSVPINFLHPVAGTPFENYYDQIDEEGILKTLCVFRIILPKARIRYAGGRLSRFSREYQDLGIKAGINALLVGNYLTTTGINPEDDIEMVKKNGLDIVRI